MIEGNGGWLRVEFVDRTGAPADADEGEEVTFRILSPGWRELQVLTLGKGQVQRVGTGTYEAAFVAPSGYPSFRATAKTVIDGAVQVAEPIVERVTPSGHLMEA